MTHHFLSAWRAEEWIGPKSNEQDWTEKLSNRKILKSGIFPSCLSGKEARNDKASFENIHQGCSYRRRFTFKARSTNLPVHQSSGPVLVGRPKDVQISAMSKWRLTPASFQWDRTLFRIFAK
jgi:hypothetical protein